MKWIWEHPGWPDFEYDETQFLERNHAFRIRSERLMGKFEALPERYQKDAVIDLMLSEAINTNEIEGEILDRASVRSSLLALMSFDSSSVSSDQKAAGAAALLVDARKSWSSPLTLDLLGRWHTMALPEQRSNLITRGAYRSDPSPMQIVSGPYGRTKVHYEAPPSSQVADEMNKLIGWYNQSSPLSKNCSMPGIIRAGIVHLWFESIHPYDDGNGRVGRAIADQALSQYLGYPTTACLSSAIEIDKKRYYAELEKASRAELNINNWLDYFSDTVNLAQDLAKEEVDFVLNKARFYDAFADQLNERQAKMVTRIFHEGRKGFEGGISTRKYELITKCSNRTASRDLSDMLDKGMITELPGGGRSTRYELTNMNKNPREIQFF